MCSHWSHRALTSCVYSPCPHSLCLLRGNSLVTILAALGPIVRITTTHPIWVFGADMRKTPGAEAKRGCQSLQASKLLIPCLTTRQPTTPYRNFTSSQRISMVEIRDRSSWRLGFTNLIFRSLRQKSFSSTIQKVQFNCHQIMSNRPQTCPRLPHWLAGSLPHSLAGWLTDMPKVDHTAHAAYTLILAAHPSTNLLQCSWLAQHFLLVLLLIIAAQTNPFPHSLHSQFAWYCS